MESRQARTDIVFWLRGESMSDLISRQAAINELRKCRFVVDGIEKIRELPSVQPEKGGLSGWICPVCGRGLSPFTSVCPCNNGKGWEITC